MNLMAGNRNLIELIGYSRDRTCSNGGGGDVGEVVQLEIAVLEVER